MNRSLTTAEYTSREELPPEVRALLEKTPEPSVDDPKTDAKIETFSTNILHLAELADATISFTLAGQEILENPNKIRVNS